MSEPLPIASIMAAIAKPRSNKTVIRWFFRRTGLPVGLLSFNLTKMIQGIESPVIKELYPASGALGNPWALSGSTMQRVVGAFGRKDGGSTALVLRVTVMPK